MYDKQHLPYKDKYMAKFLRMQQKITTLKFYFMHFVPKFYNSYNFYFYKRLVKVIAIQHRKSYVNHTKNIHISKDIRIFCCTKKK